MAKSLSPEQQWVRLKSSSICRGHGAVKNGILVWVFDVKPTLLSRTYQLRIHFKKLGSPDVLVLNPNLNELAGERHLPHVYSSNPVKLCLHFPRHGEWAIDKSIADTIVPWAYLWLNYFEHWLATNEWQGGGKHPGEE